MGRVAADKRQGQLRSIRTRQYRIEPALRGPVTDSISRARLGVPMAVYKQKGSKNWLYQFIWDGKRIRESTKQTVKRVAEQMEAAHKATLAKGEVGIGEKKPIPSFKDFAETDS